MIHVCIYQSFQRENIYSKNDIRKWFRHEEKIILKFYFVYNVFSLQIDKMLPIC